MTRTELHHLWQQRMNDFEKSEETIKKWCDSQGISLSQFHYWRRKLKLTSREPLTHSWVSIDFEQSQKQEPLMIHLGASKIEIHTGFDPDLLADVVRVLRAL